MNLEDHIGDVLGKARAHAGVPLAAAARAARLEPADLEALEADGRVVRAPDWTALGALLHLDARKLAALAAGWLPAPVDLGQWRELRPIATAGPGFSVNCYLVWDEVTRDAALFDTGFDAAPVFRLLDEHRLQLRHLFITHSHADHIAALDAVRQRCPKVRLHSSSPHAPVDQRNRPNDFLHLGSLRITNRDTPGHADDGVTYIVGNWPDDAPSVAVVGDALFAGSMGKVPARADLAREKIRHQILALPPATLLCPGHGPLTTVAEQCAHNPFF